MDALHSRVDDRIVAYPIHGLQWTLNAAIHSITCSEQYQNVPVSFFEWIHLQSNEIIYKQNHWSRVSFIQQIELKMATDPKKTNKSSSNCKIQSYKMCKSV